MTADVGTRYPRASDVFFFDGVGEGFFDGDGFGVSDSVEPEEEPFNDLDGEGAGDEVLPDPLPLLRDSGVLPDGEGFGVRLFGFGELCV